MSKEQAPPQLQGEGDYKAARRYNDATQEFIQRNDVEEVARDAEPASPAESQQLERAEQRGRERAMDEDSLLDHPEDIERAPPR